VTGKEEGASTEQSHLLLAMKVESFGGGRDWLVVEKGGGITPSRGFTMTAIKPP